MTKQWQPVEYPVVYQDDLRHVNLEFNGEQMTLFIDGFSKPVVMKFGEDDRFCRVVEDDDPVLAWARLAYKLLGNLGALSVVDTLDVIDMRRSAPDQVKEQS